MDDSYFKFMILMYNAYAKIIQKEYDSAIEDILKANELQKNIKDSDCDSFENICKFNLKLAKVLKNKGNQEREIVDLSNEFPKNKDVIRYHASYLVNMQINNEMKEF